jgi:hypothetical protein
MQSIEDNCLLCLNLLGLMSGLKSPKYCECKVYLHTDCMMRIEESGLACPICRIKISTNITYDEPISYNIIEYPIYLIETYLPNSLSIIFFIMYVFIINIIYIIPMLSYIYIKEKTVKILYE